MKNKTKVLIAGLLLAKATLLIGQIVFPEPEFPPIIIDPGPPIQPMPVPPPNPDDFPKPPMGEEN